MNKQEFLNELEALLQDLPPDERAAALEYYTEYLDEAGPDREVEVLRELGSPTKANAEIRAAAESEGWVPPEASAASDAAGAQGASAVGQAPTGKAAENSAIPTGAGQTAAAVASAAAAAIAQAARAAGKTIAQAASDAHTAASTAGKDVQGAAKQMASDAKEAVGQVANEAGDAARHAVNATAEAFGMGEAPEAPLPPPYYRGQAGAEGQDAQNPPVYPAVVPPAEPQDAQTIDTVLKAVLFALLIFCIVPLGGALAGVLLALIMCMVIPFILGVVFVAGGVAIIVLGGIAMGVSLASGLLTLGVGVLLLGLGLLAFFGGIQLFKTVIPAVFRGVIKLFKKLFGWLGKAPAAEQ